MPERIIPLAEETGLIVALGEWVLREACARMAAWTATHAAPTRLAVNVSPVQFRRDDFMVMLRRVLAATGLAPQKLELELREGVMMGDVELALERIGQLHALGVSVAIDDFGTGYSSLSYLRRLPVDTLKIDRSCVQDLESSRGGRVPSIVQPIIALAHSLGMVVVAEGVETQLQLGMLRELGCDRAQGFVLARPQAELH
jgi:EAL domain-containing protein (putative c-di-GMP-specific phosphodiesterase class I)